MLSNPWQNDGPTRALRNKWISHLTLQTHTVGGPASLLLPAIFPSQALYYSYCLVEHDATSVC